MTVELGITPFIYLMSAALVALASTYSSRRIVDIIAILGALCGFIAILKLYMHVNVSGILTYRFSGFPPPLAVVYVADEISSILALFTSFSLIVVILCSIELVESDLRPTYYVLSFLLITGVYGCLYTGDLFNFYVSIELVAISSYAMTSIYRENPRAVRAALIYGVAGSIVTSFLLLAVFILYGSYGTLNMADISLKLRDPDAEVVFSGRIYGDIVFTSKVSLALITWVLLFKSGIMPNHFWLPEAYYVLPLPAIVLFTTSADIIGVYGFFRLYHLVFNEEAVISDFRSILINLLLLLGSASAIISALLVSRQKTIRGLVAYSSISQFSLALLGVVTGTMEAITGAVLHLITNGLGDMAVILSAASLHRGRGSSKTSRLSYTVLITGLLNLFGVIPLLPGFWSKTYLTLGFIEAGMPQGSIVVLVSTGLCAAGYFKVILKYLRISKSSTHHSTQAGTGGTTLLLFVILLVIVLITVGLGSALLLSSKVREVLVKYTTLATDVERYIKGVLQLS